MIDLKASNIKLKQRSRNILRFVGGEACTQTDEELDQILQQCRGSVKLAAVTIVLRVSVEEAEERLRRNKGVLARVFEEARQHETQTQSGDDGFVLCVDAGGTSCKAVILSSRDGELGTGTAGPCNVTNVGIDAAISTISEAIQAAVDDCRWTRGCRFQTVKLLAAWVGMAGYDRPSLSSTIDSALSELLNLPLGPRLRVSTDIDLLPTSVSNADQLDHVVVVVAGTGSIAMSYDRVDGQFRRTQRMGGWGYLLGDDGSGYGIGREALRTALFASDLYRIGAGSKNASAVPTLPPLSQAIFDHFKAQYPDSKPEDLLSAVLLPDPLQHQAQDATLSTTKRVAGVAKLVLSMAETDDEAKRIVEAGVARLVDQVALLVHGQGIEPARSGLVLAGGMTLDHLYRDTLVKALEAKCGTFQRTERVAQPAVAGARDLLSRVLV
ncbi:hypothetical protein VTK73DRAFT_3986 [Phialemonium thermophilum]|uniref:N-acetyl-D-glucosamine kinase n=1 Tax=Phialemonium thermophilum TaxID=223376 RepID=A0ABR3VCS0_9PEZI